MTMTAAAGLFEPETVLIPGGEFSMGCDEGAACERPVHRVNVEAFGIGRYTVNNLQYRRFVEDTDYAIPPSWADPRFTHPDQPVTCVSWHDANAYCDWLTRGTGKDYRLPTEAEWERAARGGVEARLYTWGDQPPEHQRDYHEYWKSGPEPGGRRPASTFGLYDISENVHEWCADWFDADYYSSSPARNPRGPAAGSRKASRGGSWRHKIKIARVAARSSIPPDYRYNDYGFRVVVAVNP
jgi:formylglycine-generating enzyme required for sulfatase activity